MGTLLKFLSILSGSSEEALLNVRAQVSNRYGSSIMSNETEKNFVFKKITTDIPKLLQPSQVERMSTEDIVGLVINYYCENKKRELVRTINRVLVYYYNYELDNEKSLRLSLKSFSRDLERYIG